MTLRDAEPLELVAHRGAGSDIAPPEADRAWRPGAPPENTMPAFELGWSRCGACELDLRSSADGELVVIHDATTGRTCDRDLTVSRATLSELRRLDAGVRKGEIWRGTLLPTLDEVVEALPEGARLYVEAKHGPGMAPALAAAVRAHRRAAGRLSLMSFHARLIGELKRALPEVPCFWIVGFRRHATGDRWEARYARTDPADERGLEVVRARLPSGLAGEPTDLYRRLVERVQDPLGGAESVPLDGLNVSWRQPDGFAAAMAAAGVRWGCWTVDAADAALSMAERGAIQITSNQVDDVRVVLERAAVRPLVAQPENNARRS